MELCQDKLQYYIASTSSSLQYSTVVWMLVHGQDEEIWQSMYEYILIVLACQYCMSHQSGYRSPCSPELNICGYRYIAQFFKTFFLPYLRQQSIYYPW